MTAELEEIFSKFPIAEVLPLIRNNFKTESIMVLQAAPGAGKTTIVPLALLDASFLNNKKIIMLEPRRLAARSAALWMSKLLDDQPGGIIGYRTRFDTKVSSHTRVEIVTEGILTRMIQDDPRLDQFGLVVFDEFHERHLNTDLGLALTLDLQSGIREDLRILLMSATLNASLLAEKLKAVMICCEGRSFPVETFYKPKPQTDYIEKHARNMVLEALDKHQGSILVFLPGVGEIRRLNRYLEESIKDSSILLAPLYGDLVQAQQDHAIQPPPQGKRKIVLATSIAETSLTIEDVNIVIDCGLSRIPAYDPASGMSRLVTVPVTKASADQRRGRAGRIRPGICYRLWSEHDQNGLLPENRPEILSVDLAGLVLELSLWGIKNPNQLFWIDEPPVPAYAEASGLLKELGAIATDGSITAHGKAMSGIGAHPRLAHMMIRAEQKNLVAEGSLLAALLQERDIVRSSGVRGISHSSDIALRLQALQDIMLGGDPRGSGFEVDLAAAGRTILQAKQFMKYFGSSFSPRTSIDTDAAALLLVDAFPDRIGKKRSSTGSNYQLSNGRGAFFKENEPLAHYQYIVAPEVDISSANGRIILAAGVNAGQLMEQIKDRVVEDSIVEWNSPKEAVVAVSRKMLGQLVLEEKELHEPPAELISAAVIRGIRTLGLDVLPWSSETKSWCDRVSFLRGIFPEEWPDVSGENLLVTLEEWVSPFLSGMRRKNDLSKLDLKAALENIIGYAKQRTLDQFAPIQITVPSGSHIFLDYSDRTIPVLAVRIQEVFGMKETPRIANGKIGVKMHLLSPGRKPIQITQDLASFWRSTYQEVRQELKIRYSKHYWPEDPYTAEPTSRVKSRMHK